MDINGLKLSRLADRVTGITSLTTRIDEAEICSIIDDAVAKLGGTHDGHLSTMYIAISSGKADDGPSIRAALGLAE